MVQNRADGPAVRHACQVKVGVIGQIDDRLGIGCGAVGDTQLRPGERVGHSGVDRAGKTLIAIRAVQPELHAVRHLTRLPEPPVEALRTAVQRIRFIVGRYLILPAAK